MVNRNLEKGRRNHERSIDFVAPHLLVYSCLHASRYLYLSTDHNNGEDQARQTKGSRHAWRESCQLSWVLTGRVRPAKWFDELLNNGLLANTLYIKYPHMPQQSISIMEADRLDPAASSALGHVQLSSVC